MTLDPATTINEVLKGFGCAMTNIFIARVMDRLNGKEPHRAMIDKHVGELIEAIGNRIIEPALAKGLLERYGTRITKEECRDVYFAAKERIGAYFAEAILPDLQKPGLIKDMAAFEAESQIIAEGLSAMSKDEILDAIAHLIEASFHPIPSSAITPTAPIKPKSIKPDERKRILGMISAARAITKEQVMLHFDPPESQNHDDADSEQRFCEKVTKIMREVIGQPIEQGVCARGPKNDPLILYNVQSLSEHLSAKEIAAIIHDAIQESKNQARGPFK